MLCLLKHFLRGIILPILLQLAFFTKYPVAMLIFDIFIFNTNNNKCFPLLFCQAQRRKVQRIVKYILVLKELSISTQNL